MSILLRKLGQGEPLLGQSAFCAVREKTWGKDSGAMCMRSPERVALIRWFVSQEISPLKAPSTLPPERRYSPLLTKAGQIPRSFPRIHPRQQFFAIMPLKQSPADWQLQSIR
jgi:hypothetical protein